MNDCPKSKMLKLNKVSKRQWLHHHSHHHFATVVVGGSARNHGSGSLPRKRRGPKVTGNETVNPGAILVKQKWWLEPDKLWYGGFNVHRGNKGILNAAIRGSVLYYYDTNEKKKYVSVVPEGEDPRSYMRPFYDPATIYKMAKERARRMVKLDASLNVNKKNKQMNEVRNTQLGYLNQIEHIPMELILKHEMDARFKETSFEKLCKESEKLSDIKPEFEEEQIEFALRNKLKFDLKDEPKIKTKTRKMNRYGNRLKKFAS